MSATRSRSVGARSRYDWSRARNWSSPSWITAGSSLRMTDALCRSETSTCDSRRATLGFAFTAAITRAARSARPSSVSEPPPSGAADRPSMIGRSRSAYCGPYWSMITPRSSTRYRSAWIRPIPIGSRSDTTTSMVDGSERRSEASRTHGDAISRLRQRSRSVHTRFSPRRPLRIASTSPFARRWLPRTVIFSISSTCAWAAHRGGADDAVGQAGGAAAPDQRRQRQRAPVPLPARRLDVGAAETAIGLGRHAHGRPPSSSDQAIRHRADRSRAERDDDIPGPDDPRDRRHQIVEAGHQIDRHGDGAPHRRAQRLERHPGDRLLAGRVDIGQQDVIGAGQRRSERVHQRGGARVAMRLKGDHDAPPERARRRQHRRDLGRVMAVVVDHEDPVRLAADVEAPLRAAEVLEAGRDAIERQPQLHADRHRCQRVQQVVPSGHRERQRPERGHAVRRSPLAGAPAEPRARRFTVAVTLIGAIVTSVAIRSAASASSP